MRPLVIAFVLGAAAIGILAFASVFAVGVAAQSGGWHSFRAGLGPIVLLEFRRSGATTSTTIGSGALLLAVAGGLLNAAAAWFLAVRRGY